MDVEGIKLTITIISAIIALLSFLGFGTVFAMLWKDRHDRKVAERNETSQLRENARNEQLKKLIGTEFNTAFLPISNSIKDLGLNIKSISDDLHLVKKGVQATCRNDLEDMYAKAEHDGFCSNEDKQRFEATYQAYHSLGKNGVMDAKREKLLALPDSKTTKKRKKVLVENK